MVHVLQSHEEYSWALIVQTLHRFRTAVQGFSPGNFVNQLTRKTMPHRAGKVEEFRSEVGLNIRDRRVGP